MSREFIYMHLTGPTASFRIPTTISGTQLALETPGYSSILGMLSYATGREITPEETQIGYIYLYSGKSTDLETVHRWNRKNTGSYSYEDTNIRNREIHYNIDLRIILSNTDLMHELQELSRPLTFGRSQDLATLEEIKIVDLEKIEEGNLIGTLLPVLSQADVQGNGIFYNLPEYFEYKEGKTRRPKNIRLFLSLPQYKQQIRTSDLWRVVDGNHDFYLYQWSN